MHVQALAARVRGWKIWVAQAKTWKPRGQPSDSSWASQTKAKILVHLTMQQVINFYKFIKIDAPEILRADLLTKCLELELKGTILLAHEGLNAGLWGAATKLDQLIEFVSRDPRIGPVAVKKSQGTTAPYRKMECRIKPSIVTFAKEQDPTPESINTAPRQTPVEAQNTLEKSLQDPGVVVIDTRNDYETDWGRFEGAVTLPIKKFSDFPAAFLEKFGDAKDKKFLFYCTGGIRCEKVVPWAIAQGFKGASQIDGGIIGYLDHFGQSDQNRFEGSCFVFDQRWAVGENLDESTASPLDGELIQPKPTS
jgi:UPF0176 protein